MKVWIAARLRHEDPEKVRRALVQIRKPMLETHKELHPDIKSANVVFWEDRPSFYGGKNYGPEIDAAIDSVLERGRQIRAIQDPDFARYLELKERYEPKSV